MRARSCSQIHNYIHAGYSEEATAAAIAANANGKLPDTHLLGGGAGLVPQALRHAMQVHHHAPPELIFDGSGCDGSSPCPARASPACAECWQGELEEWFQLLALLEEQRQSDLSLLQLLVWSERTLCRFCERAVAFVLRSRASSQHAFCAYLE